MEKDQLLIVVGQRIRELRKAKGYSQEEFAAAAGLDPAYYGGVERGERNLSIRNVIRIAGTLEVEVGDLFPLIEELPHFVTPGQRTQL